MLDLIRIRREGYPVHIDFAAFVSLYKCLCKGLRLPKDTKEAVCKILTTLKYPSKDWQVLYCFSLILIECFINFPFKLNRPENERCFFVFLFTNLWRRIEFKS